MKKIIWFYFLYEILKEYFRKYRKYMGKILFNYQP